MNDWICIVCGRRFRTEYEAMDHIIEKHSVKKLYFYMGEMP